MIKAAVSTSEQGRWALASSLQTLREFDGLSGGYVAMFAKLGDYLSKF